MRNYRPTWADIDLAAVRFNYKQVKAQLGKETGVLVIVKGNAYGHGIVEVSNVLKSCGADYLGVATMDEALTIRANRINTPILVLGAVFPHEVEPAMENGITLTLCDMALAKEIDKLAGRMKKRANVHIKVDTGMGRIGIWHEEAFDFIKAVNGMSNIAIEGIYTHFSIAGRDKFFTSYQMDSFEALLLKLHSADIDIKYKHAANSIALVGFKRSHLNLVRPGLIIYGMYPKKAFARKFPLKPVMSLKTRISFLKHVPAGRSISYGRTYITERPSTIATLPIGYADGYGRIFSNKAKVLVRGHLVPVIGKVTMDQTMIDVTGISGVKVGDEVVLIGRQGAHEIHCVQLARLAGTIAYEIVCSITGRVPRCYKR